MSEPRLDFVMCANTVGTHRMAYWEWGDPDNDQVLLCVHGLTRTGRDFDEIARRLSAHYRVVCPDVVGRGKSDWLINPAGYVVPQYVADMLTLIARLRPARLDWIGTSMGGLIGLGLVGALLMSSTARPDRGRFGLDASQTVNIGKIVLNDIGPNLNQDGLGRIADYVGQDLRFDSFSQAVDYVRSVSAGFGEHTQAQWEELTQFVFNQDGQQWVKHYDLRLAQAMALQNPDMIRASEQILWAAYDSITSPILIVKGEVSDLLSNQAAKEMLARNPHAQLLEIPKVGHAPTFLTSHDVMPIEQFLLAA